jgi:hypothetical protein
LRGLAFFGAPLLAAAFFGALFLDTVFFAAALRGGLPVSGVMA